MPVLTSDQQRDKDARARLRECFDDEVTHLRAGDWRGRQDSQVHLVGHLADLHGSVCSCCEKRGA